MAANTQYRSYNQISNRKQLSADLYMYGSAAPARIDEPEVRRVKQPARKVAKQKRHMSIGYVLFLCLALCVSGFVLTNYIRLTNEMTNTVKQISSLESQLNNLKLANDEEYNRIVSSVDLEEIKRVAIGELGMTYATEGQVNYYTKDSTDYMRSTSGDFN